MNLEEIVLEQAAKEFQLAIDQEVFNSLFDNVHMKLVWETWPRSGGHWLRVQMAYEHGAVTPTGLSEHMLIPVQDWCVENNCGERMGFDLFRFKNKKEVTMFLLRWT